MFVVALTLAAASVVFSSAAADGSVLQLRLRMPDIRSDAEWASTFGIIRANPGCCDEVWFSTGIGYPPLAVHAERAERMKRVAEDLRRIGIVPSLQVQATLGHSDRIGTIEDCSAKDWTGWTSSTGLEDRVCSCPRDPKFLAYFREVAKLYAAFRPGSVWIDDDLRYDGHMPASPHGDPRPGCWCDRCISDFNRETGGAWTRETLLRAVGTNEALLAKWKSFSVGSLVGVAQTIAGAFRETSPGTMMGLQQGMKASESIRRILEGLHGTDGAFVGYRPGGGCYYDDNPNDQIWKSMCTGRCRRALGDPSWVKVWTPEIESCPRNYGSRSAQSILIEGFTAFMYGMNAMSMLVIHTGHEPPELYSAKVLAPIAKAAPFLRAYARACAESTAVGFGTDGDIDVAHRFASLGIPLNVGVGKIEGMVSEDELRTDRREVTTLRIQELRDALDRRAGGATAVLESPFVGHMMPRLASDGSLRLVSLVSVRIEEQGPLTLRLRHVPAGCTSATWREMNRVPVTLPLVREGDAVRVTIPSVSAWNAGWLDLNEL